MFTVELRFYEELNDFLARDRRKRAYSFSFAERRSVKDLIESQGVPHTEVDLILANGESVGFEYIVRDGDRISVYPRFESFDIGRVSRLGRPPLRQCRFIADVHLGKLVRRLRLLGFDCLYNPRWGDAELAARSAVEKRILLTRDRGLLKRAVVSHGVFLHSDAAAEQLKEVLRRLDLTGRVRPLARCLKCNGDLKPVAEEVVRDRVPARTLRYIHRYLECDQCGKVYWKGTHWSRLRRIIREALSPSGSDADSPPRS
ncbi:MAG: Mut7-C ubiquitin/RNAse domain-containing protein [Kiritimatiellaeota bacterium]|nr:Mut7-C ubiquitin/RNAse domain-containing protein [Kiritimatiellota bacterium]